ncbi:uncharacterized protein LOC133526822 [Cydia pomonella]|uniref:uncharacterized protein LOC133526822 n=1 Tax=Cydia pomonella TaxID=82600 RepID=UPI002ADD6680|nr:uncharacterized protein LOC133526822 [Cydia pomonella]
MDEDIAQILHEWGLSEYYEIFKQNKITLKTFNIILDQGMIQELIKPIEDRATFISNLNLWKQISNDDDDDFSLSLSQGSKSDINVDVLSEKHRNVPPIKDITNFQSSQDGSPSDSSVNTSINLPPVKDLTNEIEQLTSEVLYYITVANRYIGAAKLITKQRLYCQSDIVHVQIFMGTLAAPIYLMATVQCKTFFL